MQRPIVFLDIDGVLAHDGSDAKLDAQCLRELDRLVDVTRAELVLTSSWRDVFGLPETQRRLAAAGLRNRLAAAAPAITTGTRTHEILAYLRTRPKAKFAVLDDVPIDKPLRKHLVLVDDFVGLTAADVNLAIRLLT